MGLQHAAQQKLPARHVHHHSSQGSTNKFAKVVLAVVLAVVINVLVVVPLLHNAHGNSQDRGGSAGARAAAQRAAAMRARQEALLQQDLLTSFDRDQDGLLGPQEFEDFVKEACVLEGGSQASGWVQQLARWFRWRFVQHSPCAAFGLMSEAGTAVDQSSGADGGAAAGVGADGAGAGGSGGGSSASGEGVAKAVGGDGGGGNAKVDASARLEALDQELQPLSDSSRHSSSKDLGGEAELSMERQRQQLLLGCGSLTVELARAVALRSTVVVSVADWAMFDTFGVNWLTHVQRAGIDNYLLAALDAKTAEFLRSNKLGHCFVWPRPGGGLPKQAPSYRPGSSSFQAATWARLHVLRALMDMRLDVIMTDLDVVWQGDPLQYLELHAGPAELVLSSDALSTSNPRMDAGLEAKPQPNAPVTVAVVYARASDAARAAVDEWLRMAPSLSNSSSSDDSDAHGLDPVAALRRWLSSTPSTRHPTDERLLQLRVDAPSAAAPGAAPGAAAGTVARLAELWGFHAGEAPPAMAQGLASPGGAQLTVLLGLFSPALVANAYTFGVARLAALQGLPAGVAPLALHPTWGGSGAAGAGSSPDGPAVSGIAITKDARLHLLRDATWYADGPKYYSDLNLLTFEFEAPAAPPGFSNMTDQEAMLAVHVSALEAQLKQLYHAVALAVMLDRAIVLPPMLCFCFNGHAGATHLCRAPGDTVSQLPFNCSIDQVLALPGLVSPLWGRRLLLRESSFLDNPRLPGWVRHSRTDVISGSPPCGRCAQPLARRPPRGVNQELLLPERMQEKEVLSLLKPHANARWLHFQNISVALAALPADKSGGLDEWAARTALPWCCRGTGGGGAAASSVAIRMKA